MRQLDCLTDCFIQNTIITELFESETPALR